MSSLLVLATALLAAQGRPIDLQRSTVTIHVGKAGLFSIAGHEHWIEAPVSSGVVKESSPEEVQFRVEAAKLRVKPDPNVNASTQSEIQKSMQEKVLESAAYPEIVFRSARVEKQANGRWSVEGALSLHGTTKTIRFPVTRSGDAYTGRTTLRQTDFGIKPITAAGGTVKVKNELDVEFQIFTTSEQ
jgi:hypothetical protein